MIIDTWGRQSAPYVQGMHFLFGLGAFVAPLISEPFLGHSLTNHSDQEVSMIPTSAQPLRMDLLHSTRLDTRIRFARDVQDEPDWLTTISDSMSDANNSMATTELPGLKKPIKTGGSGQLDQASDVAGGKDLGKYLEQCEFK